MAETAPRPLARRAARLGAVQALYQMDVAGTDLADVLAECAAGGPVRGLEDLSGKADFEYFQDIVRGVVREQRNLDPRIDACLAEGWQLARLDVTLRAILRAAAYELVHRRDVPVRVIINEHVDLAHAFFGDDEPRFVNGVLDRLAREVRAEEFAA